MIFLTIGDLVSLWTSAGAAQLIPSQRQICPFSAARESRTVKPWGLLCRASHSRDRMITHTEASINTAIACMSGPRFRWSRDRFVAQLLFGPNPVLDISSVFAAALKIQIIS
jgi:hypothetical protein